MQQTLLTIMPRLAAFNKAKFVEKYLPNAMNYLFSILKGREKDRNTAFVTIGKLTIRLLDEI